MFFFDGDKLETLQEIIEVLRNIGIVIAGATFIVLVLKMVIDPENRQKYIKLNKNLIIATVLVTLALSLTQIPKGYFGDTVKITDDVLADMTFEKIVDKDVQGREVLEVNGQWYVVTDTDKSVIGMHGYTDMITTVIVVNLQQDGKLDKTDIMGSGVDYLRLFSKCQGTFKGYFATIEYLRLQNDEIIKVSDYTNVR